VRQSEDQKRDLVDAQPQLRSQSNGSVGNSLNVVSLEKRTINKKSQRSPLMNRCTKERVLVF